MSTKYSLVDPEGKGFHEDHWAVRVDDGELEGMVFQYDTVKILPQEDPEDGAVLEFNTITINSVESTLTETEERDILGDILVDIIQEQIENENRAPDTE